MKQYGKTPVLALFAALLLPVLTGCGDLPGSPGENPAEEFYTVSFDPQGGLPAPAAQTVTRGGHAERPADPLLEGHTLAGWRLSLEDGPAWDFAADIVEGDITLYARWTATVLEEGTWELSFNTQGGGVVAPLVVQDGEIAEKPPDPVRSGHSFAGWYKEAACETPWDFALDRVTGNTVLYAKWLALNAAVRFDPHGGSPAPQDQTVELGGRVTQPAVAREGFLLTSWGLSPEGGPAWDFALDTVEESITLHARWTAVEEGRAAVTFDAQGGSPVPPAQSVAIGGKAEKPGDPSKTGFEFDGWFKETAGLNPWEFEVDTVAGATILYAKWTAVYAVVFDSRGGGAVETVTLRAGSKLEKPADPVRGRDRFEGWYSSITNTPWNFDGPVTASMTLSARWTAAYTVTFDSRGGSEVAALEGTLEGGTVAQPADPARAGNAFAGWFKEAAVINPWDFAVDTVTANTTLYAKWTAVVRFDPNGGGPAPEDQTVTSGSLISRPADPALGGKSFAGWHKEAAGTNPWDFASDTVTANTTLYARWEIIFVTGIVNVPEGGMINEALNLSQASVVPADASVKTIVWTVKDPGTTGVNASTFTPTAAGTLILTATVQGGGKDASGNPADYARDFSFKITAIRKVTDIVNVPTNGFTGIAVDLSGAAVIPANASYKDIVWTLKDPGTTGVAAISGAAFTPAAAGTLVVTASVAEGDEDETGALRDYTKDFSIAVDTPVSTPGGIGLGEDTTIKFYANADSTPLSASAVTVVARDSVYFVRILTGYTNAVWHLNGKRSTATGNRLYLDTGKTGLVKVTVEAAANGGAVDTGTHTFKIE